MKSIQTYEKFKKQNLSDFINKVKKAKDFATKAHIKQKRKGGAPYIIHPDAVAKIVHDTKESKKISHLIAAAYLHDTVEDTHITLDDIKKEFGDLVMTLVDELTTDEEKLAISGKEEYLIDKMLGMSSWALVIKLADRLHNLEDFEDIFNGKDEKRKKWARKYGKQTENIINELEWYRDLSWSQNVIVDAIKDKLRLATELDK